MGERDQEGVKVELFSIFHFFKQVGQEVFAENGVFFEQLDHIAEVVH